MNKENTISMEFTTDVITKLNEVLEKYKEYDYKLIINSDNGIKVIFKKDDIKFKIKIS